MQPENECIKDIDPSVIKEIATNVYFAATGQEPDESLTQRIESGVNALSRIRDAAPKFFHALCAVGLAEAKDKLETDQAKDYAQKLIDHCIKNSGEYL